jgi:hypothetical protein
MCVLFSEYKAHSLFPPLATHKCVSQNRSATGGGGETKKEDAQTRQTCLKTLLLLHSYSYNSNVPASTIPYTHTHTEIYTKPVLFRIPSAPPFVYMSALLVAGFRRTPTLAAT